MRSGTVPNRGLNSRLSRDLSQTEKIVLKILEMGDDQSTGDFGPLGDDDDVPDEEEEMDEEDMIGLQSSPNGGVDMTAMPPPPPSYSMSGPTHSGSEIFTSDRTVSFFKLELIQETEGTELYLIVAGDSSQAAFDVQYEVPTTEGQHSDTVHKHMDGTQYGSITDFTVY